MNRPKLIQCLLLSFSIMLITNARAQTSLGSSEQSTAGGSAQSANFALVVSALGQPVTADVASSAQFSLLGGFVPTTVDEIEVNLPPVISHTATTTAAFNQNITISATIADAGGVGTVTLKFRRAGDNAFTSVTMAPSGNTFQGTIPDASVTFRGVEYFIEVVDLGGLSDRDPATGFFSVQVILADRGVINPAAQPAGGAQTAYRLISLPFDADAKAAGAVLEDDLGTYNDTQWRFFELLANQQYDEFPTPSAMTPGKAFWLIVRDAGKIVDTGAGKSNRTDTEFSINLNAGWNFIGNPFAFAIPLSKVRLESGAALDIRDFDGEFATFTGALLPFDGYAVFRNATDRLLIDPALGAATGSTPKEISVDAEHDWAIRISARIQDARDTQTIAAVRTDAANGWDEFDRPEAPVIGEYVSLYFPHPEWGEVASNYTVDVRPQPQEGEVWKFEVKTNIRDVVKLSFLEMENVPSSTEIFLVDDALQIKTNLRESNFYSVAGGNENAPKQLKLLVGTGDFIDDELGDLISMPTTFELAQNFPNPFNPSTTIRFGLPRATSVTLKIYNLLGAEITTLLDEMRPAGFHAAVWDGRDRLGQPVASGIYVYQLVGDGISISHKMAMLK